jgi:hypothetical protein
MKHSLLFLIPSVALALVSCSKNSENSEPVVKKDTVKVVSVTLDKDTLNVAEGESALLVATVLPDNATDKTVQWTSSDANTVSVDNKGAIKANHLGSAVITATASGLSDACVVIVKGSGAMSLVPVDPVVKILLGKPLQSSYDTIRVARKETAELQLAIVANEAVSTLSAKLISFDKEGSNGIAIKPTLGWERFLKCSAVWHDWAGGAPKDQIFSDGDMYPDPIMPLDEWQVSLDKGGYAGLWCEFPIPENFTAGLYKGVVSVSGTTSAGTTTKEHTFYVQVYPVTLPKKHYQIVNNWEAGNYAAMNNGVEPTGDDLEQCRLAVLKMAVAYGQNAFRIEIPPIQVTCWTVKNETTGKYEFRFDFSKFDAYYQRYIDNCPNLEQVHFMSFCEKNSGKLKMAVNYIGEDGSAHGKGAFCDDADAATYLSAYFSQMEAYLKTKKLADGRTWLDITAQSIFDEPDDWYAQYWNQIAKIIKAAAPDLKLIEPTSSNKLDPTLCDYVVPLLGKISSTKATGNQVQWFYTAMGPQGYYANRLIRMPLIKTRLLHWVGFKYNAVGYLHWGLKYWQNYDDPYGDLGSTWLPGGDSYIIYPGYRKVYPSIRFAALRDGMCDYDLLKMVAAKSDAKAQELLSEVVWAEAGYNIDAKNFRKVRRDILEYLGY